MNMQTDTNSTTALFQAAEKVFSKASVKRLRSRGLDFIETGSDGAYLFDRDGNRYLDCYTSAAMFNLGRANPVLLDALKQAVRETDQGNFVAISEEKALLASSLARFMPGNLECSLFTVVRGEAMEAACKIARGYSGRSTLLTVNGGWYGRTGFSLTLSEGDEKFLYGRSIPGTGTIQFGDIDSARKIVNKNTAAVVLETIQLENGCRGAGAHYFRELRELCTKTGTLLIIDESQAGFGRTGKKFSFELSGIMPDMVVFGESITGGIFPMSGVVFTKKIKSFFDEHPLIHLCTFGGHDTGCRVALKALELYEHTRPWENALLQGDRLGVFLEKAAVEFPGLIRSVDGAGLARSILFTSVDRAVECCILAREHGLIVQCGEVDKTSVIFRPPLTITSEETAEIITAFSGTLKGLA
ncbi:MAG: aspartate aminotransferase family protein [bacterium]|nr:aspartate aminotransferase family protein [bacterium]